MSIGLPRRTPTNKRVVACNICGKVWNVATTQDTRKGYHCPECSKGRVQNMKIEQIREAAEKKLFVGKKIKVIEFGKDSHGANVLRKRRTGTVTGLYPFIFTAIFAGGYTESFRYSQFFESDGEVVRL